MTPSPRGICAGSYLNDSGCKPLQSRRFVPPPFCPKIAGFAKRFGFAGRMSPTVVFQVFRYLSMHTSRFVVPVLAALLIGACGGSFAANAGSPNHSAKKSQHRVTSTAKRQHAKPVAQGKHHKQGKRKQRPEKVSAKGRHTVADQLAANPKLADRLASLIEKTPADMPAAVAGFKNFGQFVATAHASNNLGIPFEALKAEVVNDGGSLGKGIQVLSPDAHIDAEVLKANQQAQNDLLHPS